MNKIKILIVDSNFRFIKSAINYIMLNNDLEILGGAITGEIALTMINDLKPDLILLDLSLPDMKGIDLLERIKQMKKSPRVVIVSFKDHQPYQELSIASGADGFISKSEFGIQIFPLIHKLFTPLRHIAAI
jgi:two-component system, NarL family, response regulator DegU